MDIASIPYKFQYKWAQNATAGFVTTPIPATTTSPAASQSLGFPPETAEPIAAGGTPPNIDDYNGVYQYITAWLQWAQAGGPVAWDSTFSTNIGGYPQGAVVASATTFGLKWLSTVDNNTTNPDAAGAGWVRFPVNGSQVITASGNFTVPTGVTLLKRVRLWSAGGGSGGTLGAASASTGGAAGGYAESVDLPVTPGQIIAVTIGAGGTNGTQVPTNGGNGGSSSFLSMSATGGGGGLGANAAIAGGPYPIPGTGSGGNLLNLTGGNMSGPAALGGGIVFTSAGGMAPMVGVWQNPGSTSISTAGANGAFPGGGASGSACQQNGGTGANGLVLVEW